MRIAKTRRPESGFAEAALALGVGRAARTGAREKRSVPGRLRSQCQAAGRPPAPGGARSRQLTGDRSTTLRRCRAGWSSGGSSSGWFGSDHGSEPTSTVRHRGRATGRSVAAACSPMWRRSFTDEEADILRRYVTTLDGPVFALVNLPEVVKGALFARYSRSAKTLRRLFLDEFVGDLDISGDASVDATVGLRRAEELYDRVFLEYGDDSVAQLGGVHLACEQASNLLTKVLEWGRLDGLPRAVDPVRRLRQQAGHRSLPLLPGPRDPRLAARVPATSATWTGCSRPTPSSYPSCRRG